MVCNSKFCQNCFTSSLNFDFIPGHVDLTYLQSHGSFRFLSGCSITTKIQQNKLMDAFLIDQDCNLTIILTKFVKITSCPNQHLIIRTWLFVVVCYRFADSENS